LKVLVHISIITIVIGFLISTGEPTWAVVYYVDPEGNDKNDGSLKLPFATIQKAIDEADGGKPDNYDIVHVSRGTYITGPVVFNNDNLKIVFEKDVSILAISNSNIIEPRQFSSYSDRLFVLKRRSNIIVDGDNTVLQMNKHEYGKYLVDNNGQKHGIGIFSCNNIIIQGLIIKNTGGDGIFIGSSGPDYLTPSRNIFIKDIICTNVMRNGIQVASADGLTIDGCRFLNNPHIGISFEPDKNFQQLTGINVRYITIKDGRGSGLAVALRRLKADFTKPKFYPYDVDFVFENINIINCGSIGISITRIFEDGPGGYIKFKNVTVDGTGSLGASIYKKSSQKADISFENCIWRNIGSGSRNIIIGIASSSDDGISCPGGVKFINCQVFDNKNRPAISTYGAIEKGGKALYEVHGNLYFENNKYKTYLYDWKGAKLHNVDLTLHSGIADFCKEKVEP